MKRKLKLVSSEAEAPKIVHDSIASVPNTVIAGDMNGMFRAVHNLYTTPRWLRRPLRVTPSSASVGMGMEYNFNNDETVIRIDSEFLGDVLRQQQHVNRKHTARYFIDSTIAHALIKDSPKLSEHRKNSDYEAMLVAWRWAGVLALEQMQLPSSMNESIVRAVRGEARTLGAGYQQDVLHCYYMADMHSVEKPKLQHPPAWVGIGFPEKLS